MGLKFLIKHYKDLRSDSDIRKLPAKEKDNQATIL